MLFGTAGPRNRTPGTCADTDSGTMERGSKQTLDVSSHTRGIYQFGCVYRQTPSRVLTETAQTGEIRRQIKESKLTSNRFKVSRQCRTLKNNVVGRDHLPAKHSLGTKMVRHTSQRRRYLIVERCTDSGGTRTPCLPGGDRSVV